MTQPTQERKDGKQEPQFNYYVLCTVSGKEVKVKEALEREIATTQLGDYVTEVLLPMERTYHLRNGKKVSRDRPYYTGYLFVRAKIVGDVEYRLRTFYSFSLGLLTTTHGPTPLDESEVKRIKEIIDKLAVQDTGTIEFFVGDKVKVVFGPFLGFIGEVTEVQNEKKKLKLLVRVFSREVPTEVDFLQVEKETDTEEPKA